MTSEDFQIPDNLVGLVIGKGGEQILRLQTESGCKIQIAPESQGLTSRSCTLTGTDESRGRCKQLLSKIVERGQQATAPMDKNHLPPGTSCVELPIPGQKAGLVIGKGGETIRRLQEEYHVKMVMIQDTNQPTMHDKPLRITGSEPDVAAVRDQIMNLLASKDMEPPNRSGRPGDAFGDFGPPMDHGFNNFGEFVENTSVEVPVPNHLVGVVIGKQGDMIKKIQTESDSRIQFKKEDEPGRPQRMCRISGTREAVHIAQSRIHKLVSDALQSGRGGGSGNRFEEEFTQFPVPNEKCGFVIGKGGENIKQINQTTGALCEISKDPPPNNTEKLFNIKGSQQQIRHAINMICERANITPPAPPGPGGPPPIPSGPVQSQPQPTSAQPYPNAFVGAQQPQPYENKGVGMSAPFASMDSWSNAYAQPARVPNHPASVQQQQQQSTAPTGMPHGLDASGLGGQQADYSAAWAEYFRQTGMQDYANAILQQQSNPAAAVARQQTSDPQQMQLAATMPVSSNTQSYGATANAYITPAAAAAAAQNNVAAARGYVPQPNAPLYHH